MLFRSKNYGVIAGGIENGEAITENTVIYAKSYSYQGTLFLEKSIQSETPDENGYYTLQFSAKSQNLPSIKSENQNFSTAFIVTLHLVFS